VIPLDAQAVEGKVLGDRIHEGGVRGEFDRAQVPIVEIDGTGAAIGARRMDDIALRVGGGDVDRLGGLKFSVAGGQRRDWENKRIRLGVRTRQ